MLGYDEPASYLGDACVCPKCGGHHLKTDRDILDVWWDSGVSLEGRLRISRDGAQIPLMSILRFIDIADGSRAPFSPL